MDGSPDSPAQAALRLAGHDFLFEGAPAPSFPAVFSQFISSVADCSPIARYQVLPANGPALPPIERGIVEWQSDHWCLARAPGGDDLLLAIHVLPDERPLTVARFRSDFSGGELLPIFGRHGAPSPHAFNYPCDQVAVLNRLQRFGVVVVHAGAVSFDGQGLLFCGRSGAGKTTLSRLCREAGATLLNDDRQFIWRDARGAWLAPTPWHGSEPEVNHHTVPLRAILHLRHAPGHVLTPRSGADAAARLLGNTVAPFYFADAMERVLAICDALTEKVPSYQFDFAPAADAVGSIRHLACPT